MRKILIILIIVLILLFTVLLFRIIRNRATRKNCDKLKGGNLFNYNDFFASCLGIGQPCRGIIQGFYNFEPETVIIRKNTQTKTAFALICGFIIDDAYPVEFTPVRCVFVVKLINIPPQILEQIQTETPKYSLNQFKQTGGNLKEIIKQLKTQIKEFLTNNEKTAINININGNPFNIFDFLRDRIEPATIKPEILNKIATARKNKLIENLKISYIDYEKYKNYSFEIIINRFKILENIDGETLKRIYENENFKNDILKRIFLILSSINDFILSDSAKHLTEINKHGKEFLNMLRDFSKIQNKTAKHKTENPEKILSEINEIFKNITGNNCENIEQISEFFGNICAFMREKLNGEKYDKQAAELIKDFNKKEPKPPKTISKTLINEIFNESIFYNRPEYVFLKNLDKLKNRLIKPTEISDLINALIYMQSGEFITVFPEKFGELIKPKGAIKINNNFLNLPAKIEIYKPKILRFNRLADFVFYFKNDINYEIKTNREEFAASYLTYIETNTAFPIMEKKSDNTSVSNSYAYISDNKHNENALKKIISGNKEILKIFVSGSTKNTDYADETKFKEISEKQTLKTDFREKMWFRYVFEKEKPTPNASTIGLTNFAGLYEYENGKAIETNNDRADIKPNSLFEKEIYVLNYI